MGDTKTIERLWTVPGRDFRIESGSRDDLAVLKVSGEIDVYTFPTLWRAFEEVISTGQCNVVMDFSNVTFLDSGGISVLIRAHKLLAERSGKLLLERVHGHAYRVLQITGLIGFLNIQHLDHDIAA